MQIKELLVDLQQSKAIVGEDNESPEKTETEQLKAVRDSVKPTIEILTNLLFEALQQVNIIPNMLAQDLKQEAEELKNVAAAFEGIKNNLIDFKNLVY